MKCEKCNRQHNGTFGSGRFCNRRCANSRVQTKEMNEARSLKLKKIKDRFCIDCNVKLDRANKSGYCRTHIFKHEEWKQLLRGPHKPGAGGLRDGGCYSKVFEYVSPIAGKMKLNKDEIEVAKVLDGLELNWNRNWNGFSYTDLQGRKRNYYPDFYVEDYDYYVEYKGWVTTEIKHKMESSLKENDYKLLIIYSDDKRYRKLGLSLNEIKDDPNKIIVGLV